MQPLDRIDFNEPLSPSLERRVLQTIISICESYLEKYPTSEEDDEKLVMDRSLFAALSRQQRMAVKLRLSEKKILKQTIKAVEEELAKLPAVVSLSDAIIPAGRSFDPSSSKKSKQSKGVLDFVDIKGKNAPDTNEDSAGIAERRRRRRSTKANDK